MIEISRPPMERKSAILLITGRRLFPKQTIAQQIQLQSWNAMKTCQAAQVSSGFRRRYIATSSLPRIELMEDAERSQPHALRYPVKNPAILPCFWLRTDDQWYPPPAAGIEE